MTSDTEHLSIRPPDPEIDKEDPFGNGRDIFGFGPFANAMAELVSTIPLPSTLIVDGPWGSGKTVFIKQWRHLVAQKPLNPRVVYFDAFAHDFRQDPFVALTTEILSEAEQDKGENLKKAAKGVGRFLLPTIAGAGVNLATGGTLGKPVGNVLEDLFNNVDQQEEQLINFKKALKNLAQAEGSGPLILIIDELDRFRPDFALSCLELIKHVFSVPGICFVLVTNLDHLAGVVRGRYGAEMDGATYLQKFYDIALTLPEPQNASGDRLSQYASHLWNVMGLNKGVPPGTYQVEKDVVRIAQVNGLSLRDLERIAAQYAVYLATWRAARIDNDLSIVIGLCALRVVRPDLFRSAVNGSLSENDVRNFFDFENPIWDEADGEWFKHRWIFFTCKQPSQEQNEKSGAGSPISESERKSYVQQAARWMTDIRVSE